MSRSVRKTWVLAALLVAATVAVWWPALDNGFADYDDRTYVTENPAIQGGLNGKSLGWAFTAVHGANWHPLTWITHTIDWSLHGDAARGHHLTNLLLHAANTLLLFWLLAGPTRSTSRSLIVAALFALHPLHVESVAWVAERKDVLSTFFWLLALLAWVRWTRRPNATRYAWVALAMAASLLSKPMAVTLPFTLLMLDVWPLGRAEGGARRLIPLVVEKIPLFALSAASAVVTLWAQGSAGAVKTLSTFAFPVRLANAAVAYVAYLGKAVLPVNLAVIYPHPGAAIESWKVLGSVAALALATWVAWCSRERRPYLTAGWFWYVITLVPVIGLVQVGEQAMADRYTYVPLIGIFIAAIWWTADRVSGRHESAMAFRVLTTAAVLVLAVFGVLTRQQIGHWRDGETLFTHALAVTSNNPVAHANLGVALIDRDRVGEAMQHYRAALKLRPNNVIVQTNLGNAQKRAGLHDAAFESYRLALAIDPAYTDTYYNLGKLLDSVGRGDEAIATYRRALEIAPDDAQVHNNLGNSLARLGRLDEAIEHFRAAIGLQAGYGRAHANLAGALLMAGRPAEAWDAVAQARRHGFEPPEALLRDLRTRMPEP